MYQIKINSDKAWRDIRTERDVSLHSKLFLCQVKLNMINFNNFLTLISLKKIANNITTCKKKLTSCNIFCNVIYVKTTDPKLVNVDIRMNTYYGEFVPKRKSASYQGVVKI